MRIPTVAKGTSALVLMLLVLAMAMPSGLGAPGLPTLTVTIGDVDDVDTDPVEFTHVTVTGTVPIIHMPMDWAPRTTTGSSPCNPRP